VTPEFVINSTARPRLHRVEGPSLLVATLEIQETSFRRSVVLVAEHTSAGAIGFVVNRPSPQSLRQIFTDKDSLNIPAPLPAWYGGPVESNEGVILHNRDPKTGDTRICEGISLSSVESSLSTLVAEETRRLEALEALRAKSPAHSASSALPVPGFDCLYPYRYLTGYAGWGPGQLDREIQAGAWIELPMDRGLIFNTPWHQVWDRALAGLGINPSTIAPPQPQNTWLN